MFCGNCGKPIEGTDKFCPHCGAPVPQAGNAFAPQAGNTPVPQAGNPAAPQAAVAAPPRAKGRRAVILVAVLVLLLGAVLLIARLVSGNKGTVARACAKTVSAFEKAYDAADLPDLTKRYQSGKWGQQGEISLEGVRSGYGYMDPDAAAINGLGLRWNFGLDTKKEKLSLAATPFYGAEDLMELQFVMDGSKIYAASPELTDGTFYGVDTKTVGKDLEKLGARSDLSTYSFNTFEVVEQLKADLTLDKNAEKALKKAGKKLWGAVKVKKAGKETIEVNGSSVKATAYAVTIPNDALREYLAAAEEAADSVDMADAMRNFAQAVGMPDSVRRDMEYTIEYGMDDTPWAELFDEIDSALDELGDIGLTVYLAKGRLAAVTYETTIEDSDVTAGIYLGGGAQYVDDLSAVLSVDMYGDTSQLILSSSGNHAAKGGTFTDETTLQMVSYGYTQEMLSSELSYNTKQRADNFSWDVHADGERILSLEGQLDVGKNSMDLAFDTLEIGNGYASLRFSGSLSVGDYKEAAKAKKAVMLSDLKDADELMEIGESISENAERWSNGLSDDLESLLY